MILSELRMMSGPNMWSEQHRLVVIRLASLKDLPLPVGVFAWGDAHLPEKQIPGNGSENPAGLLAGLLAGLVKSLQPDSANFFCGTQCLGEDAWYALCEYSDKETAIEAAYLAAEIVDALLENKTPLQLEEARSEVKAIYETKFLGPSTGAIVNAAIKRDIPVRRSPGGFYIFGQAALQKRISATISHHTGDIAVDIAGDKDLTKAMLEQAMIPVPKGLLLRKKESLNEAIARIGFPLVVKPLDANQGKGITTGINDEANLNAAFSLAKTFSNSVIVEKHLAGNDYRLLVIGNKLVAAALRKAAFVTGDGRSTIEELIHTLNKDPFRGDGHGKALTQVKIDEHTIMLLRSQGLSLQSVPGQGVEVTLKGTCNLSTGGSATDVTDLVHPDNVLLAERVAAHVGLDICGIDIVAPDISIPLSDGGGAVIEVNAAPGLRMHVSPTNGQPRRVGEAIIDMMFPSGNTGRIPIVAVTGTNGKTTTTRLMAHLAMSQGYYTGLTTSDGIYLQGRRIVKGDCTGARSATVVLQEPSVEFAALECARGGIIRSGLAFDKCDIGIVTNVAADHIGLKDIYTVEDLARVKAVIPRAVKCDGYALLNASDDLVYAMRKDLNCRVALFCIDARHPRIIEHCSNGGIAAVLTTNKNLVILVGSELIHIENVLNVPLSMEGKADFMIENILAAMLAAHLLGFHIDAIRTGLSSFSASVSQTPGRLNKFVINEVNVLLDYAHNPHGLKALAGYLANLGREITGIVTAVGDRRDEDIVELGKVAAAMFNKVVIRFDKDTRGRSHDSIATLLIRGLLEVNPAIPYTVIADSEEALVYTLENSGKGNYVVISADDSMDTIAMLNRLTSKYTLKQLS